MMVDEAIADSMDSGVQSSHGLGGGRGEIKLYPLE